MVNCMSALPSARTSAVLSNGTRQRAHGIARATGPALILPARRSLDRLCLALHLSSRSRRRKPARGFEILHHVGIFVVSAVRFRNPQDRGRMYRRDGMGRPFVLERFTAVL